MDRFRNSVSFGNEYECAQDERAVLWAVVLRLNISIHSIELNINAQKGFSLLYELAYFDWKP